MRSVSEHEHGHSDSLGQLISNPSFLLLWFAQLISYIGDWALWIAIPVIVYTRTGSVIDLSFTTATEGIPLLLFSPIAGVLSDRWDRRRIMILSDIVRAIMVLVLVLAAKHTPLWLYYVALFVVSTFSAFFLSARFGIINQVVSGRQLMRTNAFLTTSFQISEFVGPALGGWLLATFARTGSFLFDAISFIVSATCITVLRLQFAPTGQKAKVPLSSKSISADLKKGFAFIYGFPALMVVVAVGTFSNIGASCFNGPEYAFARDTLHIHSQTRYGILVSSAGIGSFIAGIALGTVLHKLRPAATLTVGLVAIAIGGAGYALSSTIWIALAPHMVLGCGSLATGVATITLIQNLVPREIFGRVLGAWSVFTNSARVIGGTIAGPLAAHMTVRLLFLVVSICYVPLALFASLLLRPGLKLPPK